MSIPVSTARTPAIDSAARVSILRIFAWAWGLRTTAICAAPSRWMSATYLPCPVIKAGSSRRLTRAPINCGIALRIFIPAFIPQSRVLSKT